MSCERFVEPTKPDLPSGPLESLRDVEGLIEPMARYDCGWEPGA